ncbi:hypothetical protein [Halomicrobium sp. LC1Hm]|uniref:hypothetical protein n=1 Tax=Halomicrobium sp. LC1Hm TaxID=2610902 RepID=UPI0012984967|nr:hypothetical protein [Halomicrobium sp. LC1Hm]QGA81994.1 hypothetical protein LC1Hm_0932 [Halomicrobium sp. LC1Hm]
MHETTTEWPSGWTPAERALTVAEDVDAPSTVERVALEAEVEVAVVEEVAAQTEAEIRR